MRVLLVAGVVALAACEPQPPGNSHGQSAGECGGAEGLTCGAGAYCAFAPEAACGAVEQSGMCRPVPDACTMQYDPVCGCDGETYGNACMAAGAGVSVAHGGQCG